MHELGICDALLKMVDGIACDEGLACVRKVTVEVGSLSGVVPAYLADCWDAVTDGTPYQRERQVENTAAVQHVCGRDAAGRRTVHRLRREIHC